MTVFGLPRLALWAFGALTVLPVTQAAENRVVILHVSYTTGQPVDGVRVTIVGSGAMSGPTDSAGIAVLQLPPKYDPGTPVTVQLLDIPDDSSMISPLNGSTAIPKFDPTRNIIHVFLLRYRDAQLMIAGIGLLKKSSPQDQLAPLKKTPPRKQDQPRSRRPDPNR
jgi:hypothetical protein